MRRYFKLLLLLNGWFITGCTNYNNDIKPFTKIVKINVEIFIKGDKVADPKHIMVMGEYLLLGNKNNIPLLEVYDISSKEIITRFLHTGNGPNEVLMVGNTQYISQKKRIISCRFI